MYISGDELLRLAESKNVRISEIVIEEEAKESETDKEQIMNRMKKHYRVMRESAEHCLNQKIKSVGGIIGGDAKKLNAYAGTKNTLCGQTVNKAMAMALSTSELNAAMGRICAAPTAGSAGIIPAAILSASQTLGSNEDQIVHALLTASGIGKIIAQEATLSGAEGGCQAECGSAASMAAAAVVELSGGSPKQSLHAAALALKAVMGLICDPIAGLVESPCALRNASGVINALTCADMALAGVESVIPFDEVVGAMYKVGKALPVEFRETALGGIAATETGKKIQKRIFEDG